MNHIKMLIAITAILLMTGFVQARKASGPKQDSQGLKGTITKVGERSFLLAITGDKVIQVDCDNNTKFMRNKIAASASEIKEGIAVGVVGVGVTANRILAVQVNFMGAAPKPKSST